MGMCAHDPIPIGVMDRFLGKEMSTLLSVKECPLLLKIPEQKPPIDRYDSIPRIYTHYSTLNEFRQELISKLYLGATTIEVMHGGMAGVISRAKNLEIALPEGN